MKIAGGYILRASFTTFLTLISPLISAFCTSLCPLKRYNDHWLVTAVVSPAASIKSTTMATTVFIGRFSFRSLSSKPSSERFFIILSTTS
uniref:Uncharacterized protein n=1 Tax=Panstrongylus lignarius TaxID=156445 RepID=A0A224XRQ5_9HEMI